MEVRSNCRHDRKILTSRMRNMNIVVLRKERESSKTIIDKGNEFACRGSRPRFKVRRDDVEHGNLLSFGVIKIAVTYH